MKEFDEMELQILYTACIQYGNSLSEETKLHCNLPEVIEMTKEEANRAYSLAVKITSMMK